MEQGWQQIGQMKKSIERSDGDAAFITKSVLCWLAFHFASNFIRCAVCGNCYRINLINDGKYRLDANITNGSKSVKLFHFLQHHLGGINLIPDLRRLNGTNKRRALGAKQRCNRAYILSFCLVHHHWFAFVVRSFELRGNQHGSQGNRKWAGRNLKRKKCTRTDDFLLVSPC